MTEAVSSVQSHEKNQSYDFKSASAVKSYEKNQSHETYDWLVSYD